MGGGPEYVVQGGSRILNATRVDQSGADNADVIDWVKSNDFILAVNINSGGKDTEAAQYKLRWRALPAGSFVDVAATGVINYNADTSLVNGDPIVVGGRKCDSQGGDTWQNGEEVEGAVNSDSIDLPDEYETEIHFGLDCSGAADGVEYEFELYDDTLEVTRGTCGATIKMAAVAVAFPMMVAQSPNPKIKPRWVAPAGVMESVVAYNCRKYGFPRPILAMPMWELGGNALFDLTGNGRSELQTVGTGGTVQWEGEGIYLENSVNNGNWFDVPVKPFQGIGTGNYTLAVGGRLDSAPSGIIPTIFSFDAYNPQWGFAADTGRLHIYDGVNRLVGVTDLVNKNFNVAYVRKGIAEEQTIGYIDGVQDCTGYHPDSLPNPTTVRIGWDNYLAEFYNGLIRYLYFWRVALTPSQIKFLSDNPYFMYRMPEELYGYSPAAVGAIMNQFQKANMGADLYNGALVI